MNDPSLVTGGLRCTLSGVMQHEAKVGQTFQPRPRARHRPRRGFAIGQARAYGGLRPGSSGREPAFCARAIGWSKAAAGRGRSKEKETRGKKVVEGFAGKREKKKEQDRRRKLSKAVGVQIA